MIACPEPTHRLDAHEEGTMKPLATLTLGLLWTLSGLMSQPAHAVTYDFTNRSVFAQEEGSNDSTSTFATGVFNESVDSAPSNAKVTAEQNTDITATSMSGSGSVFIDGEDATQGESLFSATF